MQKRLASLVLSTATRTSAIVIRRNAASLVGTSSIKTASIVTKASSHHQQKNCFCAHCITKSASIVSNNNNNIDFFRSQQQSRSFSVPSGLSIRRRRRLAQQQTTVDITVGIGAKNNDPEASKLIERHYQRCQETEPQRYTRLMSWAYAQNDYKRVFDLMEVMKSKQIPRLGETWGHLIRTAGIGMEDIQRAEELFAEGTTDLLLAIEQGDQQEGGSSVGHKPELIHLYIALMQCYRVRRDRARCEELFAEARAKNIENVHWAADILFSFCDSVYEMIKFNEMYAQLPKPKSETAWIERLNSIDPAQYQLGGSGMSMPKKKGGAAGGGKGGKGGGKKK